MSSCAAAACLLLAAGCGTAATQAASGSGGHNPAGPAGFVGPSVTPQPSGSHPTQGYPCLPASGSGSCASPTPASAAAQVSLDVTIYAATTTPATPTGHFTLSCDPTGGTVPDPAAACAELLADPGLFAPPSGHVMCPMILASASRFVVYGTYLGKQVSATIADGGCDIPRWVELNHVFG